MTMTLPVLDAALRVVFLVVGAEKAEILCSVLTERPETPYPSQLVQPREGGQKLFLVDEAAAALVESAVLRKPGGRGKIPAAPPGKPGKSS